MPGKNIYRVGTDGTANYSTLEAIPSAILAQGDTSILLFPGTYTALTNAVMSDIAFIGVGDREEIVISGDTTIANTSSGTISFENLTITGSDANAALSTACVTKLGAASTPLAFKGVTFNNAAIAVAHNGERAFATTTKQVTLTLCDASAVDRSIVANANVTVSFSELNSSSNAYFTPGTGGGSAEVTITVLASTSGGANTGNCTKTVKALLT